MFSYQDMLSSIRERYPDFAKVEDDPNDTSKGWKVPGFAGKVGFITSMVRDHDPSHYRACVSRFDASRRSISAGLAIDFASLQMATSRSGVLKVLR